MIELKNINKKFGNNVVIDNLSIKVKKGEMIGITGKSGCGKSTLLNIIGTLDNNFTGELIIDGNKVTGKEKTNLKLRKNKLGYLFQNFALLDDETVEKNLRVVTKNKKKMLSSLKKLGISDKLNSKIYTLSGGEQQRVSIARLILKNPDIILADEPTGSLDDENEKNIFEILRDFKKEGKTIIVVTHEQQILSYFDRVIKM